MTERMPPSNPEAERSVLGSLIRDNTTLADVRLLVSAADFYSDAHQKLFRACCDLADAGKPIDLVTLGDCLHDRKQVDDIGGYGYLSELWDVAPTAANAVYYAGIVREKAQLRALIHATRETLRDTEDQAGAAADLLAAAEQRLYAIAERTHQGEALPLAVAVNESFAALDARMRADAPPCGIQTGLRDLDELTGGLQDGELCLVGARTSVGKTTFASNIMRHAVLTLGLPALFVSLEQKRKELADRLLCDVGAVDSHRLRKGIVSGEDIARLHQAGQLLRAAPLLIDDHHTQDMGRIGSTARRLKRKQGLRLVLVDYVGLVQPESKRDHRVEQVAGVMRRLKALARELDVPVVAMAQLNRNLEDRGKESRPRLSDLKESGACEQDSDTVILLSRRDYQRYDGLEPPLCDCIVAKQRNGPTGEITLYYRKPFYRFEDYLPEPAEFAGNGYHDTVTSGQWPVVSKNGSHSFSG